MRRIYDFGVIHYFIKDEGSLNGTYIVTMLGKESKVGAQWVQIPLLASIKIGRILIPWGNGA